MEQRRFVLLDRDGTINVEKHYLNDPDELELLPGAGEGLRYMMKLGLGLVIITNQSAIGRGYFTMERLEEIHDRLRKLLADEGVVLEGIYICPHDPTREICVCRKPMPGMVEQAVRDFGFDPASAFMIGDKVLDIQLGQAVGATSILVRTGYGRDSERQGGGVADFIADDLREAARFIETRLQDGS